VTVHWQSAVDFVVLTIALYLVLRWGRQARALRLALTVLALRVGALLARQFDLLITSWVLDAATVITFLALLLVFQPELRRALMRLDATGRAAHRARSPALSAISTAAASLARERCGALIVIVRKQSVAELVTAGIALGGRVSAEILAAVFQKGSPVHDGAVVIEGDLITHVKTILPLTQRPDVRERYGTRHRAGMGLAERSDALVVVVSEERGEITVMWESQARLMSTSDDLLATLTSLVNRSSSRSGSFAAAFRAINPGLITTALALAALIWSVTFLFPGRSVRVRRVPVEFTNVPAGLTIAAQSTDSVEVWLRSNQFLFDTVNLDTVVARCDLTAARQGANTLLLGPSAIDAPFGIRVENLSPAAVQVRLEPAARRPAPPGS